MSRGVVHVTARHRCDDGDEYEWTLAIGYRYIAECRTDRFGDPGWPEELETDELPDTCPRCGHPLTWRESMRLSEDVGNEIVDAIRRPSM